MRLFPSLLTRQQLRRDLSWKVRCLFLLCAIGGLATGPLLAATSNRTPKPQKAKTYLCGNKRMTEAQIAAYRGISLKTLHLLRTQRGMTNEEVCAIPEAKLARAIERAEHPRPDHPDEAVAFRLLQLRDENGFIPADGLAEAARHVARMKAEQAENPPPAAGITRAGWTSIGPGNIGGRVRSVLIHPTTPATMWAGSVAGGIWKTANGGASWQVVDDFMANLAVATLVMDPANSNTMYAGTGEGFFNGDAIRGAGVFKSTDGGTTWPQLSSTANSNWYFVNRLAIDPNNNQILLAATGTGIWRSTDGGSIWTQTQSLRTLDIEFHPTDSALAVAGGSSGRAWYSINGGVTWTLATGLPSSGRVEVAYARSDPSIVYASVEVNSGETWKSSDGGQSYSRVNTGYNYLGGQGWYDNIVWVDPTNPNTVIVGGIDLWRSVNGGSTLTKISQWFSAPNSAHADHHAIVEHPNFNGTSTTTVYFGNDGGVYKTDNVYTVALITGWQELNNTFAVTQFYGAAGNSTSQVIVGGTQDNGTLRYAGNSEAWTTMFGGDGGWCASDPIDPNYFYGEYVYLQIHRSTNGGLSSSYIYSGISDAGTSANFISPFILDPNNPNTLLGGGASLWRSTNVKAGVPSWSPIKSSIGSNISAIAVAPGNSNIIWVGHNNGDVYQTTNGANASPTWNRMDLNTPNLPNRFVTRITIDPQNPNIVYATFGGFSPDNVWRSSDGGTTWNDVTGSGGTGLPDVPVRSLVIHPSNSSWIYAGTEVGVFASENSGATWSVPHDGPSNVSVDELFWIGSTLVAATHGRGLFTHAINPVKAQITSPTPGSTLLSQNVTFNWNSGTGVAQYWLWVGTYYTGVDIYNKDLGTNLAALVTGLPTNGNTVYVRLWSKINNQWQYNDYTYTATLSNPGIPAQITSPTPGTTLSSSSAAFTWNAGTGVSQYWLFIGSSAGGNDIYGASQGTNLSANISGLPTDGRTLYVRLFSLMSGSWQHNAYTYTAATVASGKAQVTSPIPGSTLSGSLQTFIWNTGAGVSQYWLYIGSVPGASDIYNGNQGANLSVNVSGLPTDGRTLFVRLWSRLGSIWEASDVTYTAATSSPAAGQAPP